MSLLRRGRSAPGPEARLVASASGGDAAAFDQLRAHHEAALTEFCATMLEHRREEAPGVVAETFAVARRELPGKDPHVELRPWLYALAFERCVARLDDERQSGGVLGQGEPRDQQRGAALMLGALPQTELVSLMSLAGSRPALFGLVSQLGRSAPGFLGALTVDQAAGQAVAALGVMPTFAGSRGAETAKQAPQLMPAATVAAQGAAKGADRVWNGARIAAATAGVMVVGGAAAFAVADPIGTKVQRGGAAVQPAAGAAGEGARNRAINLSDDRRAARGAAGAAGRDGTSSRNSDGTAGSAGRDGRAGTAGSAGSGTAGRVGAAGARGASGQAGSAGAAGTPGQIGPAGPSGGTGATGNDGSNGAGGGLTARERSLLKLDLEVGSIEAHVRVP